RSDDRTEALVVGRLAGDQDDWQDVADGLAEEFNRTRGPVAVAVGGPVEIFNQIGETIETDLAKAESIAVPITLLLLVIVFGSLVAGLLPLAVGVVAVMGTFLTLSLLTSFTDVSIFSINITTALGLGLAIDYSLFIVSRFREEMRNGHDVETAVVRTVDTAGRTVFFSALTVAVSLAALLVFPLYFLRSFAYAGIAVVLLAAVAAVVGLPALLAVLGTKVDAVSIRRNRSETKARAKESGMWHRIASWVMRRPVAVAFGVIVVLLILGLPFLSANFSLLDDRVLPEDAPARQVSEVLRDEFASNESTSFGVVVTDAGSTEDMAAYAGKLSAVDGVARVDASTGSYIDGNQAAAPNEASARFAAEGNSQWLSVVPGVEPVSPEGEALIKAIRGVDAPSEVLVGGASAQLVDSKEAIFGLAPLAGLWIAASTFVLLFLVFGSILVPIKAIVLNLLSLSATFGAMVWVFQEGHGSGLLNFTPTGTLDTSTPILMFCIAFGLSMDYEVFLLSRIKEEHDRTGDNTASVAMGLERTGRIVTAAAILLSVTFLAFGTSDITFIKLFGFGLALAVIMDATIVRGLLVPAFMRLAGEANWWAPAWMKRIHDRIGFDESGPSDHDETPTGPRAETPV
ncbi:MAG: MMPL family transporter, partial [Acidimicrobiia bacterium]|nr:MMPL family transporter [Acidimicrobiia bacterium]